MGTRARTRSLATSLRRWMRWRSRSSALCRLASCTVCVRSAVCGPPTSPRTRRSAAASDSTARLMPCAPCWGWVELVEVCVTDLGAGFREHCSREAACQKCEDHLPSHTYGGLCSSSGAHGCKRNILQRDTARPLCVGWAVERAGRACMASSASRRRSACASSSACLAITTLRRRASKTLMPSCSCSAFACHQRTELLPTVDAVISRTGGTHGVPFQQQNVFMQVNTLARFLQVCQR